MYYRIRLVDMIGTLPEDYCSNIFRYEKSDLVRLENLLRFPGKICFDNRSTMSGEEGFLRDLYKFSTGESKYNACDNMFGRHFSDQSRAFSWFINHIFENFKHLVHDNLEW